MSKRIDNVVGIQRPQLLIVEMGMVAMETSHAKHVAAREQDGRQETRRINTFRYQHLSW